MELSIVCTLYKSAPHLDEFHRRISEAAAAHVDEYEIIYVNDGSPDESLELALNLAEHDPRVRVMDLARNYQHLKAMLAGLDAAAGELVFLIDTDLEEEPELLHQFWSQLHDTGADVVYGVQEDRKGGLSERLTGWMFYKMLNWFSSEEIPTNLITARLMRRNYVRSLIAHREREMYLGGLYVITGFRQLPLTVVKHSLSPTTYSMRAKMREAVNAITSFSNAPLVLSFWLGMLIVAVTTPVLMWVVVRRFFVAEAQIGWASVMVSLWFLGGLIVFLLGIIGIYLSKVFIETKQRPYVLVRGTYGWSEDTEPVLTGTEQPTWRLR